ncbi:hypothetical protein M422DRAFT_120163, partial [Sphaerobolus stellatus SS14]
DDETMQSQIEKIGRKFTYMNMLWLRAPDDVFRLKIDTNYNPSNCFKSLDEQRQGVLAELREEIPAKWHDDMYDDILIRTFVTQMNTQRSNGSTRIRQAGPLIFSCPLEIFQNSTSRTATFKEDIGFELGADGVGNYNEMAPILFKDYEGKFDKWKIFRNPVLMKVRVQKDSSWFRIYIIQAYSALVRGMGSIQDLMEGNVTKRQAHSTVESQWGVHRITPGAIAMAAIYARFAASEDKTFQPIGAETKIDYQGDFEYYLEYLHDGLHSKAPSVIELFAIWNKEFYPDHS